MSDTLKYNFFCDLDETMIHTLIQEHDYVPDRDPTIEHKEIFDDPKGLPWIVALRPGIKYLLMILRTLGNVYILTAATRDYAEKINEAHGLGFKNSEIFDRKSIKSGPYKNFGIPPGRNVLIDNLDEFDNRSKRLFIKPYGPLKYVKVDDFFGQNAQSFSHETVEQIVKQATIWEEERSPNT